MNPRKARRVAAVGFGLLALVCPAVVGAALPLLGRLTDHCLLEPPGGPEASGALCGLVVDTLGVPVSQAGVAAYRGPEPCGRSETDGLGQFRIRGLAPGAYRLEVEAFGGRFQACAAVPSPRADVVVVVDRSWPY